MSNCKNHNMVFVKRIKSNGGIMVNMQCMECGEHDARAYKKELLPANAPLFDEQKREQLYIAQREKAIEQREIERLNWLNEQYTPYLQSSKWIKKRDLVLKRDDYICQACLSNKATQVHHLTYQNVFDEPLFELISICKPCHDKIHSKENE